MIRLVPLLAAFVLLPARLVDASPSGTASEPEAPSAEADCPGGTLRSSDCGGVCYCMPACSVEGADSSCASGCCSGGFCADQCVCFSGGTVTACAGGNNPDAGTVVGDGGLDPNYPPQATPADRTTCDVAGGAANLAWPVGLLVALGLRRRRR